MSQPWTPPAGNTWNDVDILFRTGLGRPITIPEGDQNNGDFQNAINWLGQRVLDLIDAANFQTGDLKMTFNPTIQNGWLLCDNRTIGSSSSNSNLTGDAYYNLFVVLWNSPNIVLLTSAGASTTKGANAAADWGANKRMYLLDARGRVIGGAGQGTGLTNRTLGLMYGQEYFSQFHDHNVSIVTASALGMYTPEGDVDIVEYVGDVTAEGDVDVAEYVGNVTADGTIVVDEAIISYNPTPVITVDEYEGDITASGTVSVVLDNGGLIGSAVITSTVEATAPGSTISVDGASCVDVSETEPTASVMSCSSPLVVSVDGIVAALTVNSSADLSGITTDVTVVSSVFTPTPTPIDHTHTASITGLSASFDHTHTATFTGSPVPIDHTHTATFTGSPVSIDHTHNANWTGTPEDLTHTHIVSGTTGQTQIEVVLYQPTLFSYILIKL